MPHFSQCCGTDEYVCQKCGAVKCGNHEPSSWMSGITENEHAGNICPDCLEKNTDWKMIAKPKQEKVEFGTFTGVMYEISVENINKLEPRHVCPQCSDNYSFKDMIACSNDERWLFKCPKCSAKIQVVR